MSIADLSWAEYVDDRFSLTEFPAGTRVLDVGCGQGRHIRDLVSRGCDAVGLEPDGGLVRALRAEGLAAVEGCAEALPFEVGEFDGLVCSVVVPYTDERTAIREWARVLRSGGEVRATYHGAGYFLRYLLAAKQRKHQVYGLRTLVATWWYAAAGRRLPGWVGDSLYQSDRRLMRYYAQFGLEIIEAPPCRHYAGFPVFIAHRLRKL